MLGFVYYYCPGLWRLWLPLLWYCEMRVHTFLWFHQKFVTDGLVFGRKKCAWSNGSFVTIVVFEDLSVSYCCRFWWFMGSCMDLETALLTTDCETGSHRDWLRGSGEQEEKWILNDPPALMRFPGKWWYFRNCDIERFPRKRVSSMNFDDGWKGRCGRMSGSCIIYVHVSRFPAEVSGWRVCLSIRSGPAGNLIWNIIKRLSLTLWLN